MPRAGFALTGMRIIKDFSQYALYPITKVIALRATQNERSATAIASLTQTLFSTALTTNFFGKEAAMFDINAREAVAAELGIEAKDLKFSDYWDSQNAMVKREREDLLAAQIPRYATDISFLAPIAVNKYLGAHDIDGKHNIAKGISQETDKSNPLSWLASHVSLADTTTSLGHAGKALNWANETFNWPKTMHYEIVKLVELNESTDGDGKQTLKKETGVSDLLQIYQRYLEDEKKPRLSKDEVQALRPLLQSMADKWNKQTEPKFGTPELVYLIGMGKVNVRDEKGAISQQAIEESAKAIEHVGTVGLKGITEENKIKNQAVDNAEKPKHSWVERQGLGVLNAGFDAYKQAGGSWVNREEVISSRDPMSQAYNTTPGRF